MQHTKTVARHSGRSKKRARLARKREKRYRYLSIVAFCLFAALLALYLVTVFLQHYDDSRQEDLRDLYHGQTTCLPSFLFPSAMAEELPQNIPERFAELWEINPDLIGWLTAGDAVDEPVVYRDNEYYLDHSFYQSYSASGTVFADIENAAWNTDRYVILYGHNMRNGSMFGKLNNYRELDYIQEYPLVTFDTISGDVAQNYVPFAVFDASMLTSDQNYFHLRRFEEYQTGDEARVQAFLDEISARSLFNIPVEVTPQDRILTLVTCSYDDPDGRLMLFCRALRDDETVEDIQALMQQAAEK